MQKLLLPVFALALAAAGCEQPKKQPTGRPIGSGVAAVAGADDHAGHNHAPGEGHGADSMPTEDPGSQAPIPNKAPKFAALPGWVSEPPKSNMRVAQYVLPKVEGDPQDATLVVYYFDGQGGTVEANFSRWCGQFTAADGSPATCDGAKKALQEYSGVQVHLLDISGSYNAEDMSNQGTTIKGENWRLLAAVMKSNPGPYFIRLLGPQKTVERYQADFDKFLSQSLQ